MIYDSVKYFENKMGKRKAVLKEGIAKSMKRKVDGSFEKQDSWWRKEYNAVMKDKPLIIRLIFYLISDLGFDS